MPVFTLYMKKVYVVVFFVIELPIHTSLAASFWSIWSFTESCSEHPFHTTEAYYTIGNR